MPERGAALALLPVAATIDYYALPDWLQARTAVQFAPQLVAYLSFALWVSLNGALLTRFGLEREKLGQGATVGLPTGLALGCVNTIVILQAVPALGYDISFLRDTPHAQWPAAVMVPWFIFAIAWFVEFNFRGFLLGRLLAMGVSLDSPWHRPTVVGSVIVSALVFAFDPFMVATFQHLHWIAV